MYCSWIMKIYTLLSTDDSRIRSCISRPQELPGMGWNGRGTTPPGLRDAFHHWNPSAPSQPEDGDMRHVYGPTLHDNRYEFELQAKLKGGMGPFLFHCSFKRCSDARLGWLSLAHPLSQAMQRTSRKCQHLCDVGGELQGLHCHSVPGCSSAQGPTSVSAYLVAFLEALHVDARTARTFR